MSLIRHKQRKQVFYPTSPLNLSEIVTSRYEFWNVYEIPDKI